MPNHCFNDISITGPSSELEKFWEGLSKYKGEYSILRSYVPMPEELENTRAYSEPVNWLSWAMENWGSKWGDYDVDINFDETEISGLYCSAWGPCNEGILNVSALFPDLTFRVDYREDGVGFIGRQVCHNGEAIEAWSRDLNEEEMNELVYED